jgi:hypothetical protein
VVADLRASTRRLRRVLTERSRVLRPAGGHGSGASTPAKCSAGDASAFRAADSEDGECLGRGGEVGLDSVAENGVVEERGAGGEVEGD